MSFDLDLDSAALEEIANADPELAAKLARKYRRAMVVLAREDPNWFCQYVLRNERTTGPIRQTNQHKFVHDHMMSRDEKGNWENLRSLVWTYPEWGKGLPLDESIPTPSGWVSMADVSVGSEVFGADGRAVHVTWVSPTHNIRVFEIEFDDGAVIRADESHLWTANHAKDRHKADRKPRLVSTLELASSVYYGDRMAWSIPLAGPAQYQQRELPIHPYVLGAWLGDGNSAGPVITFHRDDRAIFDRCSELCDDVAGCEFPVPRNPNVLRGRIGGKNFSARLRKLGVTGRSGSKYIPREYLTSSVEQRQELLAGLLDTDGTVYSRGQSASYVEVSFSVKQLADDTLELIRSLGFKARMRSEPSKLNGRIIGVRHRIFFTARRPVFWLPRKLAKQILAPATGSKANARYIVRVTEIGSVPTRCIRVDSEDHTFLAGRSYTVTHNCEVAGTPVLLADGSWSRIEDLAGKWTRVLTWDTRSSDLKEVTARASDNGPKQCICVHLENGHVMRVTENHPLMTEAWGWRRADQIKAGDNLVAIQHVQLGRHTSEAEFPDDEAEILGYLLAGRLCGKDVIVRKLDKSPKWSKRRESLFNAAGWEIRKDKEATLRVTPGKGIMGPGDFLATLTALRHNWPVDLAPSVWALRDSAIQRLLSAFFSSAFCNKREVNKGNPIGQTVGLGQDRVPLGVGHIERRTLDMIRRLMLRVGARGVLTRQRMKGHGDGGGIYRRVYRRGDSNQIWQLRVTTTEASRFWPSCTRVSAPPLWRYEKVVRVTRTPHKLETWAVEVQEEEHSYISGGVLSHNTNQVAIGHILWRLGKDPNAAFGIMCNSERMAAKILRSIKAYISESLELRDVFPNLKPGDQWSESAISVARDTFRKDPSIQAISLKGKFVGARLDGLVLDDIDNVDTTMNQGARDDTEKRVRTQAISRLGDVAWAIAIGNVWHEDDLMHRLAKTGWKQLRFPVLDEKTGESNDPEKFPLERIYAIRDEDQGPIEFQRLYQLKARIDGEQRFRAEWIDRALQKGNQQVLCKDGLSRVPSGCRTITGVDLGVKKKASSDPSAITTILEVPGAGEDVEYVLLNTQKGRWNAQEIMDHVREEQRLFNSKVFVESNGAQDFLIQLMNLKGSPIPIEPFNTGRNKYDPSYGVESLAGEMATGKWTIPSWEGTKDSTEDEVRELVEEMLSYTTGNHTGDILMSLWIAREGARLSRKTTQAKVEFGRLRLRR